MEKVRPWCGQPSDRGRLKNRTEQNRTGPEPSTPTRRQTHGYLPRRDQQVLERQAALSVARRRVAGTHTHARMQPGRAVRQPDAADAAAAAAAAVRRSFSYVNLQQQQQRQSPPPWRCAARTATARSRLRADADPPPPPVGGVA